jgi:hypothetical protein
MMRINDTCRTAELRNWEPNKQPWVAKVMMQSSGGTANGALG